MRRTCPVCNGEISVSADGKFLPHHPGIDAGSDKAARGALCIGTDQPVFAVTSYLVYGGTTRYGERPTRAEAEALVETEGARIRKFGRPRIEPHVIHLPDQRYPDTPLT